MSLASIILALFVPLAVLVFKICRPSIATATVFFGAALFLPEGVGFDFRGLPGLDKFSAPVFCTLLSCMLFYGSRVLSVHFLRWPEILGIVLIISSIGTVVTNNDPIVRGNFYAPGLGIRDIISMISDDLLQIILPFMFGTLFYRTTRDLKDLFRVIVAFALIYSPFIVLEAAISPQLHYWIYGYRPYWFSEALRFGGYRPSVFMIHGLPLALFVCISALAAFGLSRARVAVIGLPANLILWLLLAILIICKSVAAIVYFLAIFPVLMFSTTKFQLRVATALAIVVLMYPILRETGLFPDKQIVSLATNVTQRHGASLATRFKSEKLLLDRAGERFAFGWGGFSREQVIAQDRQLAIKDGFWIRTVGQRGVIGFFAAFGLLLAPIFLLSSGIRTLRRSKEKIHLLTLSFIVVVYSIDLLPNGLFSTVPFLLSGALLSAARASRSPTNARNSSRVQLNQGLRESALKGFKSHT